MRFFKLRVSLFVFLVNLLPGLAAQNLQGQSLQGQNLQGQSLPTPTGYVNDFAAVMKTQDVQQAERLAAAIKDKTGAELSIVTIESYAPYGTIETYSLDLAQSWGIGEKGKDTGIMLLLSVNEREVRIEVGYGFEGAIPDSMAGRILDTTVIPSFREGDFSGGLLKGLEAIAAVVAKEKGVEIEGFSLPEIKENEAFFSSFADGAITIVAAIIVLLLFFSPAFIVRRVLRNIFGGSLIGRSGSFGGGGRSFGGGGFSGGGFRSFGGGSFGGGGASRRF